ncbi:hypothetical protein BABINDRAFT_50902 [Babjeviella inositovora NRRL Y-12698]|uniref:SCP2 domain-containing protein n=1 Tax=Babjeviella inositovora NRRL Y-12698 TaxID=984486 RepID=A0A1E3QMZ6_9ASCO|nr:uncharacterized protein BABINDRAFT_50902 [Babjeviella inositovora NRRL Y-12698]ODQ79053.1 hypothetical protein BABINDRAFT_50902 [Babjeviella inositovora NRRL Y-12698]
MSLSVAGFNSSPLFDQIRDALNSNKAAKDAILKKTKAVFVFTVTNKEGQKQSWLVDLKDTGDAKKVEETDAEVKSADIVINVSDLNLKKLALGKANAQKLFMSGKLKVKGNVMKAVAIEEVLKVAKPKL